MNDDEHTASDDSTDDELAHRILSYAESVVRGEPDPTLIDGTVDPQELVRLESVRACLDQLERVWPHANPAECTQIPSMVGHFEVERELGRGNNGVVYLASDPMLARQVAVKVPRSNSLLNKQLRERFLREGQATANLDHPNIVTVYEAGSDGEIGFIASAYCSGPTLARWLKAQEELIDPRIAAGIIADLADAVEHAHQRGVLHRDIKPSNILLDPDSSDRSPTVDGFPWTPLLADFGLAKLFREGSDDTKTGAILGTPSYMPPEQAKGQTHDVGPRADVYGLGATFYELLSGRPPFRAGSFIETVQQVATDEPLPVHYNHPHLHRDLEIICLKCLEKDPGKRFNSAGELAGELRRFLAGEPITSRPTTSVERFRRWSKRHPAMAVSLAFLFTTLLVVVGGITAHNAELRILNEELRLTALSARRHVYLIQIRAAQEAWQDGEPWRTTELLNAMRPQPRETDQRGIEWYHLWRKTAARAFCLPDKETLSVLALSPDGNTLAVGGRSSAITLWDWKTRALQAKLLGHQTIVNEEGVVSTVLAMAFSPDGSTLASCGADQTVRIWRVDELRETLTLKGHTETVTSVAFSPCGSMVASGSDDTTVRLWDSTTGQEIDQIAASTDHVHAVAFSRDGKQLASAGWDRKICLWDVASRSKLKTLTSHEAAINFVQYSEDGQSIISASTDKTVKLWRLDRVQQPVTFAGHSKMVRCVTFAEQDALIISGGKDGVRFWDFEGREIQSQTGLVEDVFSLAVSNGELAYVGDQGFATVSNLRSDVGTRTKHGDRAWSIATAPNGRMVASGGEDATIRLWDPRTGNPIGSIPIRKGAVHGLSFSSDGLRLAIGSENHDVEIWDINSKRKLILKGHGDRVDAVKFSADGMLLATAGWDDVVNIWNAQSGQLEYRLDGHTNDIRCLDFSPDSKFLASGSDDHSVRIHDTKSGILTKIFRDDYRVRALLIVDNGRTLITGNALGILRLWNIESGQVTATIQAHDNGIRCLALANDGRTLVTGSVDSHLKFWDIVTQQQMLDIDCKHEVTGVAFTDDAQVLAASCDNGDIKLFSTESN